MPPRIPVRARSALSLSSRQLCCAQNTRFYAASSAITPASDIDRGVVPEVHAIQRFPPTQPPSHRRPDFRKTQLIRSYVSLLRSSPLMLVLQHNSVLAGEWDAIRTVLKGGLQKVDQANGTDLAPFVRLQVVRPALLNTALGLAEHWNPAEDGAPEDAHVLSQAAWERVTRKKRRHGLEPLLSGPIAIVTMPVLSPDHLKVVLSMLAPNKENPAPKRKANPAYHELPVQLGIPKFMFLGARVEGQTFDTDKARWVGSIAGGLDSLRAQLVAVLQGAGAGITGSLESASKNLYFTLEGRRGMLEEEQKPKEANAVADATAEPEKKE